MCCTHCNWQWQQNMCALWNLTHFGLHRNGLLTCQQLENSLSKSSRAHSTRTQFPTDLIRWFVRMSPLRFNLSYNLTLTRLLSINIRRSWDANKQISPSNDHLTSFSLPPSLSVMFSFAKVSWASQVVGEDEGSRLVESETALLTFLKTTSAASSFPCFM